jgi:hypothetical protein
LGAIKVPPAHIESGRAWEAAGVVTANIFVIAEINAASAGKKD